MCAPGFSPKDLLLQKLLLAVRPAPLCGLLKRLLRVRRKVVATRVGPLFIDPVSIFAAGLAAEGAYEPSMTRTLDRYLAPGGVFVDVGANEGYFSVHGAKCVGPAGRVIAVEPQQRLGPILASNFELNGLRNVTLFPYAISDAPGTARLYVSPAANTGCSGLYPTTRYRLSAEDVPMRTLDELFSEAGVERADLVKIDIEGAEYEAILGSPGLFRQGRVRAVALELHAPILRARGLDPAAVTGFLEGCGYHVDPACENTVYVVKE